MFDFRSNRVLTDDGFQILYTGQTVAVLSASGNGLGEHWSTLSTAKQHAFEKVVIPGRILRLKEFELTANIRESMRQTYSSSRQSLLSSSRSSCSFEAWSPLNLIRGLVSCLGS